ncbi:hypothetical protein NDU88_012151 [Pleurodeles waltl]|uniref:Uncharacterized protein n=1 Tax=Pleurodeles waltl TaxID=8319 RepID=A0AAV7R0N9_PLEWA|nr:hypothetical protein NDU88_012151 [Pleurodeles waltl]
MAVPGLATPQGLACITTLMMKVECNPRLPAHRRTLRIWGHASVRQPLHDPAGPEVQLPHPTTSSTAVGLHIDAVLHHGTHTGFDASRVLQHYRTPCPRPMGRSRKEHRQGLHRAQE